MLPIGNRRDLGGPREIFDKPNQQNPDKLAPLAAAVASAAACILGGVLINHGLTENLPSLLMGIFSTYISFNLFQVSRNLERINNKQPTSVTHANFVNDVCKNTVLFKWIPRSMFALVSRIENVAGPKPQLMRLPS